MEAGQFPIRWQSPGTRGVLPLYPGGLYATRHKGAIPDPMAQSISNCNVDRGIWELDKRYRTVKASPSGTTGAGIGYGYFNGTERVLAFENGNVYDIDISQIESTTPSAGAAWSSDLDTSVTNSSDWMVWQAGKYLFAANETNGIRWIEIGTSTMYGGVTALPAPTEPIRLVRHFGWPLRYTVASTVTWTLASGVTVTATRNGQFLTASNPSAANAYPGTTHTVTLDMTGGSIGFNGTGISDDTYEFLAFFIRAMEADASLSMLDSTGSTNGGVRLQVRNAAGTVTEEVPCSVRFDNPPGTDQNTAYVVADMRTSSLWMDTKVREVIISFEAVNSAAAGNHFEISYLLRPGVCIDRAFVLSEEFSGYMELGYTFKNTTTGAESPMSPTTLITDRTVLHGDYGFPEAFKEKDVLPRWGGKLLMTVDLGTSLPTGITTSENVRIYRRIGNAWYRMWNINIGASFGTSPTYFYNNTFSETEYRTKSLASAQYTGADSLNGLTGATAGCAWKRSCVFARTNGYVYFSRQNSFHDFFLGSTTNPLVDTNDWTRPRTVEVSDKQNPVIAFVSQDGLYMFTARECYVMTGESPARATQPRAIPNAFGVLGKRAACAYKAGALYATRTGLYYVEVPNGWDGNEGQYQYEEITKDVRSQWATLLGATETDWDNTIVVVHDMEIWIVCRTRYLRFTKESNWVYGTYTGAVKALVSDPTRGLIGQLEDGKLVVFGDYPTDAGTNTAGDNGTALTWSWRSKRFIKNVMGLRALATYESTATAAVGIKIYTDRQGSPTGLVFDTEDWQAFQTDEVISGKWFEVEITGNGVDKVIGMKIEYVLNHEGGG